MNDPVFRAIVLVRDDGLYWARADAFTERLEEAEKLDDDGAAMVLSALRIKHPGRSFTSKFVS